jgi:hypothetical protein
MSSFMVFLAPLALAVAAPQGEEPNPATSAGAEADGSIWRLIADTFHTPVVEQVRIEQRVVVRVSPRLPARELLAALPQAPHRAGLKERKVGKCLAMGGIAGVQIEQEDRLLLFMRDQRLISADLEKACAARDFYSGFYLERSGDGMLCVNRDMLHARTGATCSVSRLRQLVAKDD